ncbi:class I SAM-dependent methyltransferase [Streptomyces sp. 549]|uniref:class I SAM-dependent methyltransferase n=1 Tax=Streptomyces sp. 549 TaxID=3049076 RepID=UPI0024C45B8D|nr:class I SAM-dependent methyltransferase [Streptomyces sp. 549]MDK1474724.1 class I SAM-dependent methyltransferase [Streptomyces sp. 549]
MFTPQGPTFRELAVQALSSTEHGYDLLAPKFDLTPFRTSDRVLDAARRALDPLGPFPAGLDLCSGTGAAVPLLRSLCPESVTGVDISAGMLGQARAAFSTDGGGPGGPGAPVPGGRGAAVRFLRADARALPFREQSFDLAVSFGAFGHFLPRERPSLFAGVHAVLRPRGLFAFPVGAPPKPGSAAYWALLGFDAAMRVRNAVWRPRFVMYYRTFALPGVLRDLQRAGFEVRAPALEPLGRRADGSPRCRLVLARKR